MMLGSAMVKPVITTVKIVKELVRSLKDVRTNKKQCALVVNRAKRTLVILNQIQGRMLGDHFVSRAIKHVNKALKKVQNAIDNCYNRDCFCAFLLQETYALELQKADKGLDHALLQIPLTAFEMSSDMPHNLPSSADDRNRETFGNRASSSYHRNTLSREIEEESLPTNQEIENTKGQIRKTMRTLGLRSNTVGVLMPTTNLVNDISSVVEKVKMNREECNKLADVAKRALQLLKMFEEKLLFQLSVLVGLSEVNEALANAKHCIEDCFGTSFLFAPFLKESFSTRLKKAVKELETALFETSLAIGVIPIDAQSVFFGLRNKGHSAKRNGSVVTNVREDYLLDEHSRNTLEPSQHTYDNNGPSLLPFATSDSFVDTTKVLITNGAHGDTQGEGSGTLLHDAVQNNSIRATKKLIASGASVNARDTHKNTPLHIASRENNANVVKTLLASGANPNLRDEKGESPLHVASQKNHIYIVKELIASDAHIDPRNKYGWSPLFLASLYRSLDVVKELLASGANVNLEDSTGMSPLCIASKGGDFYIAKELIASGANINRPNLDGRTPLHIASQKNHKDIVKLLITNGADVNVQDNDEQTPLHVATQNSYFDVVKELIANGANVDL